MITAICASVYTVYTYCMLTFDMPLLLMRLVIDPRPLLLLLPVVAVTLLAVRWWPLCACACACGGSSLSRYCSCSPCVYACTLVLKDSMRPFSAARRFWYQFSSHLSSPLLSPAEDHGSPHSSPLIHSYITQCTSEVVRGLVTGNHHQHCIHHGRSVQGEDCVIVVGLRLHRCKSVQLMSQHSTVYTAQVRTYKVKGLNTHTETHTFIVFCQEPTDQSTSPTTLDHLNLLRQSH